MPVSPALPYWRLSGFYLFYFALVGALIPYWGLYLKSLGYSAAEIGMIAAAMMATKIIAPNFWGWLADRTGKRLVVIRLGAGLACVCFCALLVDQRFIWMLCVVLAYTFFWNAILAQFEVLTLDYLGREYQRYSRIRVWGSVGFIVSVLALGAVFDRLSIGYLPLFVFALLLSLFISSCSIAAVTAQHSETPSGAFIKRLCTRPAQVFFVMCFLLQVSHGPYYTFFSLYLVEGYDYTPGGTGILWALGVVAEILLFIAMHRFMPKGSLRKLLLLALSLTALRWMLTAYFAHFLPLLIFSQCLHAFSFALAHAVSIEWVRRYFYGSLQGQGQAFYSAASFGAGGAVGAIASGLLWDLHPQGTFAMAALAAGLACLLVWLGLRDHEEMHSE